MKKFKGCQVKQALFFLFLFVMSNALAFSKEAKESFEKKGILKNVEKLNWEGIDVIWIKDNRFPTYDITVYYGDGSLSDGDKKGETERMFSLLGKGTPKYSFKEIAEQFEFWSFSGGPNVYHEYSSYNFSGLLKDLIPTMKFVCHIFKNANFPEPEIKKYLTNSKLGFQSLVSNPSSLASRAFRELSMVGTPFAYPTGGKLKDLNSVSREGLKKKLKYFQTKVQKRIYISGPEKVLEVKNVLVKECGWNGNQNFKRIVKSSEKKFYKSEPSAFLVTVPKANQAQVRIGRYLNRNEVQNNDEVLDFMSSILGGGFTSILNREARIKRGLTYSIGAFAAGQKYYGRSGIITATRNEKVLEMVSVIKGSIDKVAKKEFSEEQFKTTKNFLKGSYPFQYETVKSFMGQMVFLDHVGNNYSKFHSFPEKIASIKEGDIAKAAKDIFNWKKQVVVILGSKSLEKELKKRFRSLKTISYESFL